MFKIGTLDQLAEITMGQSPKGSSVNEKDGIPLLNGPSEFGINHPKPVQFTTEPIRYAKKGDLLFCVRGSTGKMNWADQDYAIGRGIASIRPKNQNSKYFIEGTMEFALKKLQNMAVGTVITGIKKNDLFKLECFIPNDKELSNVNNFLGSLSKKIETNQKINDNLEKLTKILFKSWFVDFLPTHTKINKNSDSLGIEINEVFPNEIIDSEKGKIPKGWKIKPIGELVVVKRGGSPRPIHDFFADEGLPWVKISDATSSKNRFISFTKQFIKHEGLSKTVKLKKGQLILSNSATPGLPRFLNLDACIHDGWLYFPEIKHFTDQYLYQLFNWMRPKLIKLGSGSVFTNLKTDIIKNFLVVVPTKDCIDLFQRIAEPIHKRCLLLMLENEKLRNIKNLFSSKLISGKILLSDVEKIVDEATA